MALRRPLHAVAAVAATMALILAPVGGVAASRWFVAGRVDGSMAGARADVWLGFGRPHSKAVAAELRPSVSNSGVDMTAGLYAQLPGVELRIGPRYHHSLWRCYLKPQSSYNEPQADSRTGPELRYVAIDATLKLEPIIANGQLRAETTLSHVFSLEGDNYFFYESKSHAIVAPGYVWTAEIGYLLFLGRDNAGRLGPSVEMIGVPGRRALIVRAGLLVRWRVSDAIEVRGHILPPIASPDRLGLRGGVPLQLGMRYRFDRSS